jgi:hypothetical protein
MALTQISTGGVKNDAVTAGKIPANAVGSSEIADDAVGAAQIADDGVAQAAVADEAIDEARLQISNAGTNGQFLQKQSGNTGGLTWAAANEYTHPNHSGEVTSSADGATTIASNIVDEDNLKISNAGTNGQYLQKQSGNTGGLTWADVTIPPAGNTVDLVADGAIAAGKPVIIKSNGKAAQVGESMSLRNTPTKLGTDWAYNSDTDIADDASTYSASINCGTNLIFSMWYNETDNVWTVNVTYIDDTSNNNIKVKYSTGLTDSVLGTVQSNASLDLAYLGNNKVCIFWNGKSTNAGTAVIAEINPTTRAVTFGSDVSVSATGLDVAVSYDTDNQRILFAYAGNSSSNGYYQSASFSGTTITLLGSATAFALVGSNNGVRSINSVYDTNADRHVIVYDYKDYGNKGYAFSVETTGSSMSASSLLEWNSNAMLTETMGLDVCFDSVNNRTVVRWSEASNANAKLVGLVCNTSNGAVTTSGSISNTTGTYMSSNFHSDMTFDAISGRPYHVVGFQNGNHWITFYFLTYNSSNGQYSTNGGTSLWATSEVRRWLSVAAFGSTGGDMQALANRQFESSSTDRHHGVIRISTMASTTNITDPEHYIGFADQAYSDGQTATINTYGNTVNTLSGLTTGSPYYVQGDGSIATTVDSSLSLGSNRPLAGTALSASKLLIRDPLAKS